VLKHVTDKVEDPDAFIERVEYLNSHRDEKGRMSLDSRMGRFSTDTLHLSSTQKPVSGRIWYFRDITAANSPRKRVQYLAYYDALTGLPNRTLLQDRLAKALAGARRRKTKWQFCSSISTGSKTSTTRSVTRSATFSCRSCRRA